MSAALGTGAVENVESGYKVYRRPLGPEIRFTVSRGAGPLDGHIYTCLTVAEYGRMFVQHGSINRNFYEVKMWNI